VVTAKGSTEKLKKLLHRYFGLSINYIFRKYFSKVLERNILAKLKADRKAYKREKRVTIADYSL
jgi:hypothetical protein